MTYQRFSGALASVSVGRSLLISHDLREDADDELKTTSRTAMKTPTSDAHREDEHGQVRVCSRVGQETFLSSDHGSSEEAADAGHGVRSLASVDRDVAGAIGLEPTTAGFGDRCSAN